MTTFRAGERAVLMRWGRPLCSVTIGEHPHPATIWTTDDEGRSAPFRTDGRTYMRCDHADTHLVPA